MAQVTVQQLAETVGAPVDRLLTQMKEAGLPHSAAGEAVSEEDKQTLLTFLKRSHGESTAAPKRITLKRKTISTLRTSGSQGKKTVNVEVRKKRTYVKRDASDADSEMQDAAKLEAAALAEAERQAAEARAAEEAEAAEKAAREAAEAEEEAAVAAAAASVPEPEPEDEKDLDPEILRQRAAERRMAREAAEAEARKAAMEARKAEEERVKAEAAAKVEREKEAAAKRPKRLHDAPAPQTEEQRKKAARGRLDRSSPGGRGKQRGHNLSLSDLEAAESGMMRRRGGRKKMRGGSHAEHGKHGFEMPTEKRAHEVELADMTSVGGLAQQMSVKAGEVIKELMKLGVMATINQMIDQDTAILVVEEMGHKP
ncbi:MAG TPA: translation initiation factor IF-2, partial [Halieaceae bacterium]|nr:translation initiation factor IF-2 [Halieaceae bacterium]